MNAFQTSSAQLPEQGQCENVLCKLRNH